MVFSLPFHFISWSKSKLFFIQLIKAAPAPATVLPTMSYSVFGSFICFLPYPYFSCVSFNNTYTTCYEFLSFSFLFMAGTHATEVKM